MEFKRRLRCASAFIYLTVLMVCLYLGRNYLEFGHNVQCQFIGDQGCRKTTRDNILAHYTKKNDKPLEISEMRNGRISSLTTARGYNNDPRETKLQTREPTTANGSEKSLESNHGNWRSPQFQYPDERQVGLHREKITVPMGVCNLSSFRQQLRLDDGAPFIPVHLLAGCHHIINNRIAKTGSRSTLSFMNIMSQQNHFSHITGDGNMDRTRWSGSKIKQFIKKITQMHSFVFTQHMYYMDFTPYLGYSPIYINVVRDPASWFLSFYFFKKYERDASKIGHLRSVFNFDPDLESCIRSDDCWIHHDMSAIHFLCGWAAVCSNYTQEALHEARKHMYENYLVVGQTERLSEYFEVLEFLLPHMFSGTQAVYKKNEKKFRNQTKTQYKDPVNPDTFQLLKSKMKLDYELYNDAVRRFDKLLAAVRYLKRNITTR